MRHALTFLLLAAAVCTLPAARLDQSRSGGGSIYNPRICVPETVYTADGIQANIYWRQLAFDPLGIAPAYFTAGCDVGRVTDCGFRFYHADTTGFVEPLAFRCYDANGNQIASKTVTVRHEPDSTGINTDVWLFIGDSITAASTWVDVFDSLMTAAGDAPVFIGTQGTDPLHEGLTGFTFKRFGTDWVGPPANPFWDTDQVDFQSYITDNGFPTPDHVVVCLGGNDIVSPAYTGGMDEILAYVDTMVTALIDADTGFPHAQVLLAPTPYGSSPYAFGGGYAANDDYTWLSWQCDLRTLSEQLIAVYDLGASGANVQVFVPGLGLDNQYSYPVSTTTDRSQFDPRDITVNTNYIHPGAYGYRQTASECYRVARGTKPIARNLLGYSGQFNNAFWGGTSAACTVTGGLTDPFGGTSAESLVSASGTAGYYKYNSAGLRLSQPSYVLSGWIKGISGHSNTTTIRLNNHTDAKVQAYISMAHNGSLGVAKSTTSGITEFVLYAVGGDWYRFWFSVALGSDVGDVCSYRVGPWSGSTTVGDGAVFDGVQLEPGTRPTGLLRKP